MNTLVTVTVLDRSRQRAVTAQNAAFQTMHKLVPVFDRFRSDSHISRLNRHGALHDVPPDLDRVLNACSELYRQSHNHFDVTILPLLQRTSSTVRRTGNALSPKEIRDLKSLIGFRHVGHTSRAVRLERPGMGITLDGIAKGYIVDQAAACLVRHGVRSALINAGGDIRVTGGKGGSPWLIGVQDPMRTEGQIARLGLHQAAVATSGSYEQFFDPLARHHHLIDTSGYSPHRIVSSTVVAPTAMQADGLATALFLMPPGKGLQWAASLPGVQACLITRGNRTMNTPGWEKMRL
jgi:thiamine biosynthesis lipoprotein